MEILPQVLSFGGNFLAHTVDVHILDTSHACANYLVLNAATVSACGDRAHDVEMRQRGHVGQGSAMLGEFLQQPGIVHTCTEGYFLSLWVIFDISHLFEGEMNAVDVCDRVERVRRAVHTNAGPSL